MFDASDSFASSFSFISQLFKQILSMLDCIIIIGDSTSVLDFFVAVIIFSILIGAVFTVVRSSASGAASRFGKSGD